MNKKKSIRIISILFSILGIGLVIYFWVIGKRELLFIAMFPTILGVILQIYQNKLE